jgi:hypothetical protein
MSWSTIPANAPQRSTIDCMLASSVGCQNSRASARLLVGRLLGLTMLR